MVNQELEYAQLKPSALDVVILRRTSVGNEFD